LEISDSEAGRKVIKSRSVDERGCKRGEGVTGLLMSEIRSLEILSQLSVKNKPKLT